MSAGSRHGLSIVLCTYNRAQRLRQTLTSIDEQVFPAELPVELIVVNNASTDDTARVCAEFARTSRLRFRAVVESRQGLSHARNRGVEEATGEIVVFTDDDITVPTTWIAGYAQAFEHHDAHCVFGPIEPEWNGSRPPWYDSKFSMIYGALDYGRQPFVVASRNFEFFGANFACRTDVLTKLGGFDPTLGRTPGALYISEERKIFLELFKRGCRIVYDPALRVTHHVSDEMKTKDYVRKYYRDTATSLVNLSPTNTDRQILGVPYFRLRETLTTVMLAPIRATFCVATGRLNRLFALRLETSRTLRVLRLHLKRYMTGA